MSQFMMMEVKIWEIEKLELLRSAWQHNSFIIEKELFLLRCTSYIF